MRQAAPWKLLEMWSGGWRWGNQLGRPGFQFLLTGCCEHYSCPGCPLLDHLNPLFNDETWTYSNMDLALTWNLESAKPSRSESGRRNKGGFVERLVFLTAFILWTMKLELNLSAEISWNLTSLMQHCVSVPSTEFSLKNGNVKCPAPAASGETRCLQIHSEILVLNCLGA